MLTGLHIQNFVIIENVTLEFSSGLTVFTGETGAGKSIVIDALSLLLGARSDPQVVGSFGDKCNLTACFDIKDLPDVQAWLTNNDLGEIPFEECIIRRVLQKDGKSRQMINGFSCTLQQIRDFLPLLINMHGQNQHQLLMKRQYQRELLDNYINLPVMTEKVRALHTSWLENQKKMAYLLSLQKNGDVQQELLEYQLSEFEKIDFHPEEYEKLLAEQKQLANANQLITSCHSALVNLTEREKYAAEDSIYQAQNSLASVAQFDTRLATAQSLLEHALINIREAASELRDFHEQFELNPERLEFLENRISKIHQLARKYQVEPCNLTEIQKTLTEELAKIKDAKNEYQIVEASHETITRDYLQAAKALSEHRALAAKALSEKITPEMNQLGMPGGKFNIEVLFNPENISVNGCDSIEFFVSTNPGLPFQPLAKVASGGELSRIALAIYVATAQKKTTPILVFDEVDVGIGGGTAAIVGSLLKTLSKNVQVLCITHLPQVAAFGDNHLQVQKEITENQTSTRILDLKGKTRIQEIARMLGGIQITPKTLAHAKELLSCESAIPAKAGFAE